MELNEVDIQAAQEESNFNQAKEAVAAIQLDHTSLCNGGGWHFEAPKTTHAAAHL